MGSSGLYVYEELCKTLWNMLRQDWKGECCKVSTALAVYQIQCGALFDPSSDSRIPTGPSKSELPLDPLTEVTAEWLDFDFGTEMGGRKFGVEVFSTKEDNAKLTEEIGIVCLGYRKRSPRLASLILTIASQVRASQVSRYTFS